MPTTCPLCLHESSPDASACEHCGRYVFPQYQPSVAESESLTLQQTRLKSAANTPRFGDPNAPQTAMPTLREMPAAETPSATAKLVVIRGTKLNVEFPLYEGPNCLGRTAERPADIDLSGLESTDQVWSSRQHAVVYCEGDLLSLEDLNSLNGTFVNRARLQAGKRYLLKNGDVIQIGTVQLKVVV